jgi:hypothetical protein
VTPADLADQLRARFGAAPPVCASEYDLQRAIGEHLRALLVRTDHTGPIVTAEHRLTPQSRPDFYVRALGAPAGIVVEVKVDGSLSDLTRQLFRYAEHAAVLGLLVVTTRHRHRALPSLILGKPIAVLYLGDSML